MSLSLYGIVPHFSTSDALMVMFVIGYLASVGQYISNSKEVLELKLWTVTQKN